MALAACPECQGTVSTSAPRCPHCGHPLATAATAAAAAAATASLSSAARIGAATPMDEQVLWQGTPSQKILAVEGLKTALFSAAVITATALAYRPILRTLARFSAKSADMVTDYGPGFRLAAIFFVVTVVGLRVLRLGWRALGLRHQLYRLSNQRLIIETGVIAKTLTELDLRTVEDVGLSQSATERLLNLGRIEIVSSDAARAVGGGALGPSGAGATAKNRLTMIGIADPRTVRETIRGAAYQATRGQLFTRST